LDNFLELLSKEPIIFDDIARVYAKLGYLLTLKGSFFKKAL
jgi:hypothetical protein